MSCNSGFPTHMRSANAWHSWLPKVQRNLHLSRPVVLLVVVQQRLREARLLPVVLPLQLRRRNQRRKRKRKSQTRIWVSVCSTRELRSSLFQLPSDGGSPCSQRRRQCNKCIYIAPCATLHHGLVRGALQDVPLRPILTGAWEDDQRSQLHLQKNQRSSPSSRLSLPVNASGVPKLSVGSTIVVEYLQPPGS
jgi:hypothetical protein